ncbi:MAG: PAS domain S-box protein [Lutibacter sp.]
MTKVHKPNDELIKELQLLHQRHNSLKALYSKHLHKRKILQELSRDSEEKLSESNALLQIAKEKTKIGGWVIYLDTKQVYWSDGIAEVLEMPTGHKPQLDEAISFYAPEWREKITEVLTNCEQYGIPFDEEMQVITSKGSRVWIRIIGKPDMNDDGVIVKLYGTLQDICEHKFTENQLKKLSTAVEQSPVSIYMTDIEGNIEYVNPKVLEITGYTSAELIGKNPKIFSAGHISDSVYENIWEIISSGKSWRGEFHNKRKNGELFWEHASISPIINKNGKITNYITAKEDITDRKQKEAALVIANKELAFQNEEKEKLTKELVVAKERAEESDRLKSAFLANMSHEIRTPMNGILGFIGLLKSPELTEEKQQKYLEIIEKSGDRLLNIINDIVDISKIESGLVNVHLEETNIIEQIENSYNFFKPEAEGKGLKFLVKNRLPEKEAIIKTDALKIYAVLSSLVKNAIKYTEKGTIVYGCEKKDDDLEFYFKDTGIGIPKNRQEAIFERFIQADIYDKMALQGAGLGLSIAKAYVELLGGKIWVESEEGIGSTFYFTLPCNQETKEKGIILKDASFETIDHSLGNLKILIVDDDELSETLLSLMVEAFSSEIFTAKNGIEAVEICRNHPDIDLIFMDVKMPELNGYDATKQIREFNKDVVIIAQTAYGLSSEKEKAINAGCNDYIAKPLLIDSFIALIHKYFKK